MPQLTLPLNDAKMPAARPPTPGQKPSVGYNTAVREHRRSDPHALDFLPTAPWAVRAFVEQYLRDDLTDAVVLEPAAGGGDMARVLREYAPRVLMGDVVDYGLPGLDGRPVSLGSFLDAETEEPVDWVITNPPFSKAEAFIRHALGFARRGVAMLVRQAFVESVGRYERLYSQTPPDLVATFAERINLVVGRTDPDISTATCYAFMMWRTGGDGDTRHRWIAPARDRLERASDWHGWRWRSNSERPLPHLSVPAGRAAASASLARALPILRPASGAILHQGPYGAVASLLERRGDDMRVLARVSLKASRTGTPAAGEILKAVLQDHSLPLISCEKRAKPAHRHFLAEVA